MNASQRRGGCLTWALVLPLMCVLLAGSVRPIAASNFELGAGATYPRDLVVLSGNVQLEQRSRVQGSVIMLCCNLRADGRIDGSILLLTGNLMIGSNAVVQGEVAQLEGNIDQAPGAEINAASGSSGGLGLLGDLFRIFCLVPVALIGATFVLLGLWRRRRPKSRAMPSP